MQLENLKSDVRLVSDAFHSWIENKTSRLGAALAYYTVFAIAPLFLITLSIVGFCFGEKAAQRELFGQINGLVGRSGGEAIQTIVKAAANRPHTGNWAAVAAVITLGAGATAVFVELQDALNSIWGVKPKRGHGIRDFVRVRLLSVAMVLGVGFLLLVSLMLNAALAALGRFAGGFLPEHRLLLGTVNFLVSLGVITVLFGMIFKVLPDIHIEWGEVWRGAFVTALLFNLGKFLIGYYLGRSSTVSVYGAAGSFVIVLLWVYYSAQILFFGAEFTHIDAKRAKSGKRRRRESAPNSNERLHA
jgi:membrane protein